MAASLKGYALLIQEWSPAAATHSVTGMRGPQRMCNTAPCTAHTAHPRTVLHQLPHKGLCDGAQRQQQQRVDLVAASQRRHQLVC